MKKIIFLSLPSVKVFLAVNAATFLLSSCQKEDISKNSKTLPEITSNDNSTSSPTDLLKGLVAWYTFNGNTLDSSGKGNNIIFNNARPVNDRFGNPQGAYFFNGVDDYMRVANSLSLNPTTAITLFAIIKINDVYPGECHGNKILMKGSSDVTNGIYHLTFDDARYYNFAQCLQPVEKTKENFFARYGDESGAGTAAGADNLNYLKVGKWYTITYTYNGTVSKLYVNGVLKNTLTKTTTFTPNTEDLFIGKMNNVTFPYWFHGVIDEIRIYKRALTATEVHSLPK